MSLWPLSTVNGLLQLAISSSHRWDRSSEIVKLKRPFEISSEALHVLTALFNFMLAPSKHTFYFR